MTSRPIITINLPGQPIGKGRPRFRIVKTRSGQTFASVYTDAKTAGYEKSLAQLARIIMGARAPLDGPLEIMLTATLKVPSSWSRKKTKLAIAGRIRPTSKPDFDNIAKVVDGLKSICWRDDSQVVEAQVGKFYGATPSLKIEICRTKTDMPDTED